ncbi:MAG: YicC family protein [Spirochaetae bacterium HGW-Spirochaetae-1]|jgi:uncharacterized protein (TIGR00255 family)|nr:MAG: YicC family protein [Spirochaetae bacterium HGW-Spirochaetae-1]
MESMTGYAFIEKSSDQFSFSVEIKSLNSKYLETYANIPRILRNEENDLISILKERFSRGKIELSIEIYDWTDTRPVSLNASLIKKYYQELQAIHSSLHIKEPLRFESILSLEGVLNRERSIVSKKSRKDIYTALEYVVKKTIEMRKKEGMATKKDIINSLEVILENAETIKNIARNFVTEKQQLLQKRINALAGGAVDDQRLMSEIAILADKLDINEETVRLNDHLQKYKTVMKDKGQIGKKLDFIAQEMFREINTISSKSNNSEISHLAVEVKNHIDKIREQCRNVV